MNAEALQDLPSPVVVACASPLGVGGIGRHFQELVEQLRAAGKETQCIALEKTPAWIKWINRGPLRFHPAWQGFLEAMAFDASVARRIPEARTLIGFNGQCLRSFRSARQKGFAQIVLAVATAHVNSTILQARKAWDYAPIESTGYIAKQHEQILLEYEFADRILYATSYIRDSFLAEKFPEEKLRRFILTPHPRFKPPVERKRDGKFRVVSVGSLNLAKGVAVLLDAFGKFAVKDAELTLVGGSGTSPMRRYIEGALRNDTRIRLAPGDPLPHLQAADVCAHAAFQDGFGYAPMEALACGTPVIVTDQTGMKENIREGVNGLVVPAGDPEALWRALVRVKEGALRGS